MTNKNETMTKIEEMPNNAFIAKKNVYLIMLCGKKLLFASFL